MLLGSRGSEPAVFSFESEYPSLSSSPSALSPIPSLSLSEDSVGSRGKISLLSSTPSLSSSGSVASGIPSPSVSPGTSLATSGSVPLAISSRSVCPSLSSSKSVLLPIPSPSVSTFSLGSLGKASS